MSIYDREIAARHQQLAHRLIERSGYEARLEADLKGWVDTLLNAPKIGIVNPTFDPRVSELDERTSFWMRIEDEAGTVATITNRLFVVRDFVEEVEAGRIHYSRPRTDQRISVDRQVPRGQYTGRIGHAGGLWIHPRARKQGLSWLLPRLMRAYSILRWDVDRHCALVFGDIKDAGLVAGAYGFPDIHLLTTDYFPPARKKARVHLIHIERRQIIEQFLVDIQRMSMNSDKHMRDVATIVTKGHHQAAVS